MNTGFLGPAVATVLTACGIETWIILTILLSYIDRLQQYLPLAVLKHTICRYRVSYSFSCNSTYRLRYWNEVIKPYTFNHIIVSCNSTYRLRYWNYHILQTLNITICRCNSTYRLRYWNLILFKSFIPSSLRWLQQYLPLAVLKHSSSSYHLPTQRY